MNPLSILINLLIIKLLGLPVFIALALVALVTKGWRDRRL
jgi:hypothetical protein